MVYLPVKFRRKSNYFPWEIFHLQSRHPLHQSLWSLHFLWNIFFAIAADLNYVLLLGQPLPEFLCTAWHISSQPAPSVPLILGQRVLLVSPASRMYLGKSTGTGVPMQVPGAGVGQHWGTCAKARTHGHGYSHPCMDVDYIT